MADAETIVRRICLSFPEVEERLSHGHPGWFVQGKKQFAAFHWRHHDVDRVHVWCAAPPGAQEALVLAKPERYFRPPYVGHRGWVGVYLDDEFDQAELEGLLTEAYIVVCPPRLRAGFEALS
ncbi:MAG: MmcQ/YjbR family DNA-binding protein [Trueperaceae bacterium]|nr:MmcQ/YjbR family DNA-binding protein [Trueperaceae bacterium]